MSRPYLALLDDDKEFGEILKVVLRRLGLELVIYPTAEEFLKSLDEKVPEVCLVDLNIADLGEGFRVVKEVRSRLKKAVPVFVVSSTTAEQSIAHAMEIGATDFLLKPIDKELMANKLYRFVTSPDLEDFVEGLKYEVPGDHSEASLKCELEVEAIDEFGMKLSGPHLIAKGTAIRISGEVLGEFSEGNDSLLLTVTSTWVGKDGASHGAYAEFDPHDKDLHANVRKWLSDRLG